MTLEIEEGPGVVSGAFQNIDRRDRHSQDNQNSRVRQTLLDNDWVCAVDFLRLSPPIVRYGARIFQLRKDGYVIWRRDCENPNHGHQTRQYEWSLIAVPETPGQ